MTRKPRSATPDNTRKLRAARRRAILDAAAVRMGLPSWSNLETKIRAAMESAETDDVVNNNLVEVIGAMFHHTPISGKNAPPADMVEIREKYPPLEPVHVPGVPGSRRAGSK